MSNRYMQRKTWTVQGLAALSLLALLAASAPAATLSGNIIDHSTYSTGFYHVYAVRLNLDFPVVGSTIVPAAGHWEIHGVSSGHYFLFAWRDVNRNFIPSRGEPLGFYGVPFPSRVTVQGSSISNLDVVMDANNVGAEVVGNVHYNGNKTGRIWVVPHITPDLELTTVRGTPWTMTSPGEFQCFIMDHGTYYLTAFMDVNGNMLVDPGEPFGITGPVNIEVTPGVTYHVNINIRLDDRATAVEAQTWSRVKSLYHE